MIMSLSLSMAMISLVVSSVNFKNPVKLSMMLLVFSMFLFMKMYLDSSHIWFPLLFFLIFMGGILMMFMILSSILPNEKNTKNKKLTFILFLATMPLISTERLFMMCESGKSVKSFLESSNTMYILMILMILYFFISIMMVSKEECPMRSTLC